MEFSMTLSRIIADYPLQVFLITLVLLAGNLGWLLYLLRETIATHREWKRTR